MKTMKKILALTLVAIMLFAMVTAVAAVPQKKITIENAAVGKTYKLYKIFDAEYADADKVVYKFSGTLSNPAKAYFTVDANKYVTFTNVPEPSDTANFATYTAALKSIAAKVTEKTATDTTLVFDIADSGYYYVESSLNTTVTITNVNNTVTIIDKNDTAPSTDETTAPDIDTGAKKVDKTTANVGDTLNYTVEFTATNFYTKNATTEKITKYVITDTCVGATLSEKASVKIGSNAAADVTFTGDNNNILELDWKKSDGTPYNASEKVVITYTAVLDGTVTAGDVTNKAEIKYFTASNTANGGELVNPGEDAVKTNVFTITIDKYDSATDEKLSGAKFILQNSENKYYKNTAGVVTWVTDKASATELTTNGDGAASFAGIASGTYTLTETVSPFGYKLPANPTSGIVVNNQTATDGVVTQSIGNSSGTTLPTTGGTGTTILYIISAVLLIGAATLVITKKKASVID